mmetsp:Transcript_43965/g.89784  ORF Transcript_43965/g.89784 Transcript_43965/m.89784 type:complete len:201 (-) Transcript_43965:103-705(-)
MASSKLEEANALLPFPFSASTFALFESSFACFRASIASFVPSAASIASSSPCSPSLTTFSCSASNTFFVVSFSGSSSRARWYAFFASTVRRRPSNAAPRRPYPLAHSGLTLMHSSASANASLQDPMRAYAALRLLERRWHPGRFSSASVYNQIASSSLFDASMELPSSLQSSAVDPAFPPGSRASATSPILLLGIVAYRN